MTLVVQEETIAFLGDKSTFPQPSSRLVPHRW